MSTGLGNLQGDFDTTGIVVFDYTLWINRYPEFSDVNEALAGAYWQEAGMYLQNSPGSVVTDCGQRQMLLGMLTAHLANLNATIGGTAPSGLVGRISGATQGAVSVTADVGPMSANSAWFMQTKYGAAFWQATAQYRMMRYFPGRVRRPDLVPGYYGSRYGWGGYYG